jgi:hypothetical protein
MRTRFVSPRSILSQRLVRYALRRYEYEILVTSRITDYNMDEQVFSFDGKARIPLLPMNHVLES